MSRFHQLSPGNTGQPPTVGDPVTTGLGVRVETDGLRPEGVRPGAESSGCSVVVQPTSRTPQSPRQARVRPPLLVLAAAPRMRLRPAGEVYIARRPPALPEQRPAPHAIADNDRESAARAEGGHDAPPTDVSRFPATQ